jgi:hypothetical protein
MTRILRRCPPRFPGCDVSVGRRHFDECDVARCMRTGLQRPGHGGPRGLPVPSRHLDRDLARGNLP